MRKINIGLIGYGVVGRGVVQFLKRREEYLRDKFQIQFNLKALCDRSVHKKDTRGLGKTLLTKNVEHVINDPAIDIVVELIGGLRPAKQIVVDALKKGKHVVTANKELIANCGRELFELAQKQKCNLYYESSVGAGIPIIKTVSEGIVGNNFRAVYGIINGTSNYILSQMTEHDCSFGKALQSAQKKGFAESNPILDINGMDSAHKLAILVYLAFGKFVKLEDIYTEGITRISHDDIEHAESLNLSIKLLAIAKKANDMIEARVHPTLISKEHPLASINHINNAVYLDTNPLGPVLLSGEGAGQMTAASGVVSDLINFANRGENAKVACNIFSEAKHLRVRKIDNVLTKFYIRFMATDKPGTLSRIAGILGKYGIGINSVTQKVHRRGAGAVPVIMLTEYAKQKNVWLALQKIYNLSVVKSKPVAIRMEKLW